MPKRRATRHAGGELPRQDKYNAGRGIAGLCAWCINIQAAAGQSQFVGSLSFDSARQRVDYGRAVSPADSLGLIAELRSRPQLPGASQAAVRRTLHLAIRSPDASSATVAAAAFGFGMPSVAERRAASSHDAAAAAAAALLLLLCLLQRCLLQGRNTKCVSI